MKKKNDKRKNNKTSKINIQNEKIDATMSNYKEIEVDGFQVIDRKDSIKNEKSKIDNEIKPNMIQNKDDLIKSFTTQEELEKNKEKSELFDDLWESIIRINNNNIIDLSLINEIKKFLEDDMIIQRFSFLLFILFDNSIDNYVKGKINFVILKNNIKFFMIILIVPLSSPKKGDSVF